MARYWDNKEIPGRGTKFCLVIDPEDGTHALRTYGWSEGEVLEKVARTVETAQQVINRQRQAPPSAPTARQEEPDPPPISAEDTMQATADLSNPARAGAAIRTLLKGEGIDLDEARLQRDARKVAAIAEQWALDNPDFPLDKRNQRQLMDRALLKANGNLGAITAQIFDAAFAELRASDLLFEVEPAAVSTLNPPHAPNGNSAFRSEASRNATSYRSTALRAGPANVAPTKPKYTRAEVDALNSKQLREKIENEAGFREWYDREFSAAV